MSAIEKIYYNMERLSDNWDDEPETKAASDRLEQAMGDELFMRYEDEICRCKCANHKDGFVKGFEYAVSLLTAGRTA